MSIFDAYDQEYLALSREISKNIGELKAFGSGGSDKTDKVNGLVRHIEALLVQANDLIKQMEVEVRSHNAGTRKALGEKLNEYKKSMSSLKSDFERAKEQSQRSALIGNTSVEQRQRLLDANDKLARQNEMILNATRTVAETEEVGIQITDELARNREKIEASRAKAREFSGITDSARRLLSSMQKREMQQRLMIGGLAVFFILAISLTIYFSTRK